MPAVQPTAAEQEIIDACSKANMSQEDLLARYHTLRQQGFLALADSLMERWSIVHMQAPPFAELQPDDFDDDYPIWTGEV